MMQLPSKAPVQPPGPDLRGQGRYLEPEDALLNLCFASDTSGRWRHVNDRWLEYTGAAMSATLNDGWLRSLHPNDVEPVRGLWRQALLEASRFEAVCRLRRRDGHFRWFLLRASPMLNSQGEISGWVGRGTDVDILKRPARKVQRWKQAA